MLIYLHGSGLKDFEYVQHDLSSNLSQCFQKQPHFQEVRILWDVTPATRELWVFDSHGNKPVAQFHLFTCFFPSQRGYKYSGFTSFTFLPFYSCKTPVIQVRPSVCNWCNWSKVTQQAFMSEKGFESPSFYFDTLTTKLAV